MHPALCWCTLLKLYITWTLLALKLTVHVWTYPHCTLLCVDELDSRTLLKLSTYSNLDTPSSMEDTAYCPNYTELCVGMSRF